MTSDSPLVLERLLRDSDLGWMIDMYSPRERAVNVLLDRLDKLSGEFRTRCGHEISFSPETLKSEADRNPHKIRAFLQALGSSDNANMLLMVWKIIQGYGIRELSVSYREKTAYNMCVILAYPGEDRKEETYRTDDINDAALLRHFGITSVDGQPLFDGFFAIRKR